eukprot:4230075-Pleurochrysis_carterae.AAC.1
MASGDLAVLSPSVGCGVAIARFSAAEHNCFSYAVGCFKTISCKDSTTVGCVAEFTDDFSASITS